MRAILNKDLENYQVETRNEFFEFFAFAEEGRSRILLGSWSASLIDSFDSIPFRYQACVLRTSYSTVKQKQKSGKQ